MKIHIKKWTSLFLTSLLLLQIMPYQIVHAAESITVEAGESIQITGSGTVSISGKHDYAIYDSNGATSYGSKGYSTNYSINNGLRIVLENTGEGSVTVSTTSGSVEKINNPALKRVPVKTGETWEYYGDSDFTVPGKYEWASYKEDGTASSYSRYTWGDRFTKLATNVKRTVITMQEDQEIYGPYETFKEPVKTEEPAIKRVSVKAGESWEYYGDSDFTVPGKYEWASYKEDGTASSYSRYTWGDRFTKLATNVKRTVITMQEDQEIYGPYETFKEPVKTEEPAIKRVSVKAGESWEYYGDSDFTVPGKYEWASYKEDGTASSYSRYTWGDRFTKLATNVKRTVITMQEDQEIYGPYETFKEPIKTEEPAIKRVSVKAGESWEYYGDSDFTVPGKYEWASYKEDGTASSYSRYTWGDRFTKLATNVKRTVITMQEDQEIYGPYETFKEPVKTEEPAIKRVSVKAGESWEYYGDSDFTVPGKYEWASYKEDGTASSYSRYTWGDRFTKLATNVKRTVITMQEDQEIYGPYETFKEPIKTEEPAIKRVSVKAGESWEYYGDSDFTVPGRYEWASYKEDGTTSNYSSSSYSDRFTTLSTNVLRTMITMHADQEIYGPYETFKKPNSVSNPAIYRMEMNPGEVLRFKTPGIRFTVPGKHAFTWYDQEGEEPQLNTRNGSYSYSISDKKLLLKNTSDSVHTLYGPYEVFPTLRPRDPLDVQYNNGQIKNMRLGNVVITGKFTQNPEEPHKFKVSDDISLNNFLKLKGELKIDQKALTLEGDGSLYIPIKESQRFYAGQIPLFEGDFDIDVSNANLLPFVTGKQLLKFEKFGVNITSLNLLFNGIGVSGNIDVSKAFKDDKAKVVTVDQFAITTEGIDLHGTFPLPNLKVGPVSINDPYIEINSKEYFLGGGGTVGKIGKMIVPTGGSLGADFNFYNWKLNKIAIESVFPRPIPIGTTPFGLSGVGGGVDNIQKVNKDDYGTTVFVNADLSDTFSPTIDGGHLIMGDNLQFETSDLHLATSGSLKMYKLKLGESRAEWHSNKGFKTTGDMNVAGVYDANFTLKVPKEDPFNGSAKGVLKVPDDIWFIGGEEFSGIGGEIEPSKVMVTATLLGIDVGVAYDFDKDKIRFKISELEEGNLAQTQELKDDVLVTYGTNMETKGTFSSETMMSALSLDSTLSVPIPVGSSEEAMLLEVTWIGNSPSLIVKQPDGSDYPLVQTGEEANFLIKDEHTAFISMLKPQEGNWSIQTNTEGTENLSVNVVSVQQKPTVTSVDLNTTNGETVVDWQVDGADDTKVSLYVSEDKDSYTGHLLQENLPLTGETKVELPEDLMSGDYWLFIKAEREEVGTDWVFADKPVRFVDTLSPPTPKSLSEQAVNNGEIHLQWDAVQGASSYVVAPLDEKQQVDHSKSILVEDGKTSATISGWETNQNYELVLMSINEDENGEMHYSLPTEALTVFLPEPTPPSVTLDWKAVDGEIKEHEIDINGTSRLMRISNSDLLQIKGTVDQEAETTILINDEEVVTTKEIDFDQRIELNEGPNEIIVRSVATNGDETVQSYDVNVDTLKPILYIESPVSEEVVSSNEVIVKGNAEVGSDVQVNSSSVVLDEEGNFTHVLTLDNEGLQDIVITSTDMAGNVTKYETQVSVEIPKVKLTGQLLKGESLLTEVPFSFRSTLGEERWYDITTDELGRFSFEIPDGDYVIEGIWLESEQKWYQLDQVFTVKDGKLVDASELFIYLPEEPEEPEEQSGAIIGKVTKGLDNLGNIAFSIHTTDAAPTWYDLQTDSEGNFTVNLPDGEYQIDGVWVDSESEWYVLNQLFTVSSGKLNGFDQLEIDVLGESLPIEEGITGQVTKSGIGLGDVLFSLHTTEENPKWYDIQTDEMGQFNVKLSDGEYQIDGVWVESEQKWYVLNQAFTVTDDSLVGAAHLEVELERKASTGQIDGILTKDSNGLGNIMFSLHTTGENQVWYDIQTDVTGQFTKEIPDGEYQIDGVWLESENTWYPLNQVFTVSGGNISGATQLTVELQEEVVSPYGNVVGKVTKGLTGTNHTVFSIHTTDENQVWYDAKTDENGQFAVKLPNGEYQIDGIWLESESTWYPLNQIFIVHEGKLFGSTEIVVDVTGEYTLPKEAIKGQVLNDSVGLENVLFSLHTIDDNPSWYDIQTDANGEFLLNLSDGDYQIDGIWVESESKWYVLNHPFSVVNGKLNDLDELFIDLSIDE